MDIRKILGVPLSPAQEDLLESVLAESCAYTLHNGLGGKGEADEELYHLVMEHYSKDSDKCREFLNRLAMSEVNEKENCYLYGARDGIRLAKLFFQI